MIKIAGKEVVYSTSVILFADEVATITPHEVPGATIELSVESDESKAAGLIAGLNDVRLSVGAKAGMSGSIFGLHTANNGIFEGRIVAQTFGVMTKFDIQLSEKHKIS